MSWLEKEQQVLIREQLHEINKGIFQAQDETSELNKYCADVQFAITQYVELNKEIDLKINQQNQVIN